MSTSLGVPKVGPPPQLIKILIKGLQLRQGTLIILIRCTSPPPSCNKWFTTHSPKLISAKITQGRGN